MEVVRSKSNSFLNKIFSDNHINCLTETWRDKHDRDVFDLDSDFREFHHLGACNSQRGRSSGARQRLVITLRYLATGSSQQTPSYSFRVACITVSNIIKKVCEAIYDVLTPIYLKPPTSADEWKRIRNDFESLWNTSHVIGVIDGKHIAIDCPKRTGSQYYNYKGFFSIVLLAICDARYTFTMVDVGQYGNNNDSEVLLNSEMGQRFEEDSL
eukprot:gene1769-16252_t